MKSYRRKKILLELVLLPIFCLGLCLLTACSNDPQEQQKAAVIAREDLPPGKMVELFFQGLAQFDVESMCPYMSGELLEKMKRSLPQIQAIRNAYEKRDLYAYLVASGAEPKVADDIAKRIRDQKQEAAIWQGVEERMQQFSPQSIAMQEKIDGGENGKSAEVVWHLKGNTTDVKPESLYFIRQDDGLWYWVSFADYASFRQKSGNELTGAEKNANAVSEDPFGLFTEKSE